jgi:hypothetical protein
MNHGTQSIWREADPRRQQHTKHMLKRVLHWRFLSLEAIVNSVALCLLC